MPLSEACYRPEDDSGSPEWAFDFFPKETIPNWEKQAGFHTTPFNSMRVKYYMAQPVDEDCKVAISNTVLAVSLVSVSVTLAVCCYVYLFMEGGSSPLVTLGAGI